MIERQSPANLFTPALLGAVVLFSVELIKSHRSNFWIGVNPEGWQGAAIAFAFYLAAIVVLTVLFNAPLRLLFLRKVASERAAVAAGGATVVYSGLLAQFAPSFTLTMAAAAAGAVVVTLLVNGIAEWRGWITLNAFVNVVIASCLISWIAIETVAVENVVHPERHRLVTYIPAAIAGSALVIGTVLVYFSPDRLCSVIPFALVLLVGGGVGAYPYRPAEQKFARTPDRPSVFLVTCDALRADFMSAYDGHVETPHFDRIKNRGVIFEQAYALAPWTLPAVNGLYASQYPSGLTPGAPPEHWRREAASYVFDEEQKTLAERLSEKGYATALVTGNGLAGRRESMLRGFDFSLRLGHHLEGWTGQWAYVPYFRELLARFLPSVVEVRPVDTTKVLTAYAKRFVEQHHGRPVFLWLHYMDPHSPYDPPEAYRPAEGPWPLFDPRNPHWGTPQHGRDGSLVLTPEEQAYVQMLYEGEIKYVDDSFGEILDTMTETGHDGNAIVCLTADHGEEFWDHGKWGHGHSLYNEVIRVPLLLSALDVPIQRIHTPISHIDLIPTLAALAKTGADPNWQGQNLAPRLRDRATPPERPAFARATNMLNPSEPLEMVVHGDYKLIRGRETNHIELYHLKEDPHEQEDLSGSVLGVLTSLKDLLDAWNGAYPPEFESAHQTPDPQVLKDLETLGSLE